MAYTGQFCSISLNPQPPPHDLHCSYIHGDDWTMDYTNHAAIVGTSMTLTTRLENQWKNSDGGRDARLLPGFTSAIRHVSPTTPPKLDTRLPLAPRLIALPESSTLDGPPIRHRARSPHPRMFHHPCSHIIQHRRERCSFPLTSPLSRNAHLTSLLGRNVIVAYEAVAAIWRDERAGDRESCGGEGGEDGKEGESPVLGGVSQVSGIPLQLQVYSLSLDRAVYLHNVTFPRISSYSSLITTSNLLSPSLCSCSSASL